MIVLKIVGIALAVLAAGLLAYAATRPDAFRIGRSAAIKAPPGGGQFETGLANLKAITEK